MKERIKGFFLLLQFMTRLPVGKKLKFDPELLAESFALAPLAGLLCGAILTGVYYLLQPAGSPLLSAAGIVLAGVLLSGGLHLDGFADTCDGLYSYRPREEALAIMKDPRVGVFGVTGLILLLLLKTALLTLLESELAWRVLPLMPVFARLNAVWSAGLSPYAGKEPSLASRFTAHTGPSRILTASLLCLIPAGLLLGPLFAPAAAVFTVGPALLFTYKLKKKWGGITGDTLGYTIETGEVFYLGGLLLSRIVLSAVQNFF